MEKTFLRREGRTLKSERERKSAGKLRRELDRGRRKDFLLGGGAIFGVFWRTCLRFAEYNATCTRRVKGAQVKIIVMQSWRNSAWEKTIWVGILTKKGGSCAEGSVV